jgi:hypothetical protein
MHASKVCLLTLGLSLLLGCSSSYNNPNLGGTSSGTSGPVSLPAPSVNGPTIASFTPTTAPAGSPDLQLDIEGTNFPPNPSIREDHAGVFWTTDRGRTGTWLEMKDANATHLTAVIPATLLVSPTTAIMQVQVVHFMDDVPKGSSNTVTFTVSH